ncbi:T9SS type A sorting domain-containing protein [Roseivirga sp. BDSF3-8]|uniref:glucuronyl esterase domain-containing protein n=1 Tax=Roseivirga sp. BDSF3-8 TaxID=3241598 RepID=UPI0035321AED
MHVNRPPLANRLPACHSFGLAFLSVLCILASTVAFGQGVPLVYNQENTGATCPSPVLPSFSALPSVPLLPDPFAWSDGSGRSTSFSDWRCRRAEIKAEIENYEIGPKPDRPQNITASYSGGTLAVNVTENGHTLTLTSQVVLPSGSGPFPAVIGMGGSSGSLPSAIFSSRNIARITFNYGQVTAHTQERGSEPINQLHPELEYMGSYSAWSWGVSRIIDGLELVQAQLPIDLDHIGVTGCSFAGKMALFAGAFDERIALTIAQEPGGGGAAAWRVSETLGEVETLGATNRSWFMESMFQFAGSNVSKLPHDHHELMAMVAPRALLVLGNPDYEWLAEESGYVSARAAHEVWKAFGVGDRFGFSIVGGHGHCQLPASQYPEVEAFVDKFLLGNTSVTTNVTKHPFANVDHAGWYDWWGGSTPSNPGGNEQVWLEAECGTVGSLFNEVSSSAASNNSYVTVRSGNNSTAGAPAASGQLSYTFSVREGGSYKVWGRTITPGPNDDSFWVRMDGGSWVNWNSIPASTSWQWDDVHDSNNGGQAVSYNLSAGSHTLSIAYREDGGLLDKLVISNTGVAPSGSGSAATNCSGGGSVTVRARGTTGSEIINIMIDGTIAATYTLGTSYQTYSAPGSGTVRIAFTNDNSTRDVQVDYAIINGTTYEAENQPVNTGVWQNGSCGGGNSEMLHCNGYIEFSGSGSRLPGSPTDERSAEVSIYPNPACDVLTATVPSPGGEASLSLYHINGKLAREVSLTQGKNEIGLSGLESGVYILRICQGEEVMTRKLLRR